MRTRTSLLALAAFLLLAATGCPGHKKLMLPGIFEAEESWTIFYDDSGRTESMLSKARMDRMVTRWYENYEGALRALHLEDCLPCGGTGLVFPGNPLTTIRVATTPEKCTLCKGKGRILPPGCYGRLVVAKNPFPPSYDFLMSDELRSLVAFKDGKPVATTSQPGPDCTIKFTGMTITHPPPEDS